LVYFHERLGNNLLTAIDILKRLETLDPFRGNYYKDYRSRLLLRIKCKSIVGDVEFSALDLTRIEARGELMLSSKINLCHNELKTFCFSTSILGVVILDLDFNLITNLNGVESLLLLKKLSVRNNRLKGLESVSMVKLLKLLDINLEGNLLSEEEIEVVNGWMNKFP
jgi:Leucine-rich repeat (LRR) protein